MRYECKVLCVFLFDRDSTYLYNMCAVSIRSSLFSEEVISKWQQTEIPVLRRADVSA